MYNWSIAPGARFPRARAKPPRLRLWGLGLSRRPAGVGAFRLIQDYSSVKSVVQPFNMIIFILSATSLKEKSLYN